jgi:two-component system chemotaxis response regulator CheB
LLVKRGEMRVIRGPKENNFRPAIDPLFRSAATIYDGRVIGVLVSGSLDDGTHGLLQIKRQRGVTVAQSPDDALQGDMPRSAIERVGVDYIQTAAELGSLLTQLVFTRAECLTALGEDELDVSEGIVSALRLPRIASPSPFTCPECRGALWEVNDGAVVNYRCHVGHGFAADTLLMRQAVDIEQALWSAVRGFEERAALQQRTAERQHMDNEELRARLIAGAQEQQQMADLVRSLLVGPHRADESRIGDSVRQEYADTESIDEGMRSTRPPPK